MNIRTLPRSRLWAGAGTVVLLAIAAAPAFAVPLDQITVEASKITIKKVGRSSIGAPLEEIFLNARASMTGLDLATAQGLTEARNRVHAAALSACQQLGRRYPLSEPGDRECASTAERSALVQVRTLALGEPTPLRVRQFELPAS
jgi:UrcA family protein